MEKPSGTKYFNGVDDYTKQCLWCAWKHKPKYPNITLQVLYCVGRNAIETIYFVNRICSARPQSYLTNFTQSEPKQL